jgi:hypothetical protein
MIYYRLDVSVLSAEYSEKKFSLRRGIQLMFPNSVLRKGN